MEAERAMGELTDHVGRLKLTQLKNKLGDLYNEEDEAAYLEFVDAMGIDLLALRVTHYYIFKRGESLKEFSTLKDFLKQFKSKK